MIYTTGNTMCSEIHTAFSYLGALPVINLWPGWKRINGFEVF